jgi:spore maturation protein CgeB
MKLAVVGAFDGAHVGGSLWRAAPGLATEVISFNVTDAVCGNRFLRAFLWRFVDRRPFWMNRFAQNVIAACVETRPDILITTGAAPLERSTLRTLRLMGIVCVNYSTDDPWNPAMYASWHLRALPEYDFVFSTRRANLEDLRRLGCADVRYLPFGYDEWLFPPAEQLPDGPAHDVLFVGGGDRDRVIFMTEFMRTGLPVALVGGYWDRFPETRRYAIGQKSPEEVGTLTAAAKVNLCLVRRANRDGHVQRSFEIAAIGGCMLAEDTEEHRQIFGADEECVVYFRTPEEAANRARALIANSEQRRRLACAVRDRMVKGMHTYQDRLLAMLHAVTDARRDHNDFKVKPPVQHSWLILPRRWAAIR